MKLKEFKIRDIAGEKVIILQGALNADMTKIISPNESSEWLMTQLAGTDFSEETVIGLLTDRYGIDRERAASDTEAWIAMMKKHGLAED